MCQPGCRHGVPNLRSQRPITATTQTHQGMPKGHTLILPTLPTIWVTNVGWTTAIDTHNLAGTSVPKMVVPPLAPTVYQDTRHRDGVDMPDAGLHPHREAMHKQHTEPRSPRCVPFGDPHVHKVTPSGETRQGAATAAQTHWGRSTMWRGHTRPTTSPKEGTRRGVHQQRVLC